MRLILALIAVVAVGGACGDSAGPVQLLPPALVGDGVDVTVLDDPAPPGAAVQVRFESRVGARVYFHPCVRSVERRVLDAWVPEPPELRMCTAELFTIEVAGTRTEPVDVPVDLADGTYRFVFEVRAEGADTMSRLVSRPFEVRGAP